MLVLLRAGYFLGGFVTDIDVPAKIESLWCTRDRIVPMNRENTMVEIFS
jgi:hypothetical protein